MTYPPGSPGYPPAQQPTTQFAAPTHQFGKGPDAGPAAEGTNKLPVYLSAAVAVLGLAVYLSNFGPLFTAGADFFTPTLLDAGVVASVLAGLVAGVGLLPRQKVSAALAAVLSVLGFLLVILIVLTVPDGAALDWGMYLIIAFSVLQAIVAVAALLFDSGVVAPPAAAPKPRYERQYGQYGGPGQYYGHPQGQPQHQQGAPSHRQGPPQQRQSYPSQYGGYPGAGPSTGGFSAGAQSGPPTPPTGFPAYGQPPASSTPTSHGPAQPQSSSSSKSDSASS
jgi:Family of unknown function (DUF5336)